MQVVATPRARAYVAERGGRLWVWARDLPCCTGRRTALEAATQPPTGVRHGPDEFDRYDVDGVVVFVDTAGRRAPERLDIDVGGLLRRRPRAYWNGCYYAL